MLTAATPSTSSFLAIASATAVAIFQGLTNSNVVNYFADSVIPQDSKWTRIVSDNLYSSPPLGAALYAKSVLFTGTIRTNAQQYPDKVVQQRATTTKQAENVKGTLLQFRPTDGKLTLPAGAKGVLALSFYDQSPVHMVTSAHDKARVIKVSRLVSVMASLQLQSCRTHTH